MIQEKLADKFKKSEYEKYTCSIATIDNVYPTSHAADITLDAKGTENVSLKHVPLPIIGNGIHLPLPKPGQKVVVVFTNNSVLQGRIVAMIDEMHKYTFRYKNSHVSQGTYKTNLDVSQLHDVDLEKVNPLCENWTDEENNYIFKHYSYIERSPYEDFILKSANMSYFNENEIGFIHPENKSLIKIKDDGSIDIFTDDDVGVRVNPVEKRISFFSDKVTSQGKDWYIKTDSFNIESKDFTVKSDKIKLDTQDLELTSQNKKLTIEEIVKEL